MIKLKLNFNTSTKCVSVFGLKFWNCLPTWLCMSDTLSCFGCGFYVQYFNLITLDICDKIYGSLKYDIILHVQSVLAALWLHICLVCTEEQGIRLRLVYPWVKQRRNTLVWKMLVHSWVTEVRIWCRIWCELHFASIHFDNRTYHYSMNCYWIFKFIILFAWTRVSVKSFFI